MNIIFVNSNNNSSSIKNNNCSNSSSSSKTNLCNLNHTNINYTTSTQTDVGLHTVALRTTPIYKFWVIWEIFQRMPHQVCARLERVGCPFHHIHLVELFLHFLLVVVVIVIIIITMRTLVLIHAALPHLGRWCFVRTRFD